MSMKIFRFAFSWRPPQTRDEPSGPSCVHLEKDSIFYKGGMRNNATSLYFLNFNEGYRLQLESPCPLCHQVYAFWAAHCNQCRIEPTNEEFEFPDPTVFSIPNVRYPDDNPTETSDNGQERRLTFVLKNGEFGEAYHVLMCCLYCRISGTECGIAVSFPPGQFSDQMRQLFRWYGIPREHRNMLGRDPLEISKKVATEKIAETFRQRYIPELPMPGEYQLHSSTRFHLIRQYLDSQNLNYANPRTGRAKIPQTIRNTNLMERYFYPSWQAKYWLNRYFRITSQPRLPKKHKVSRLAVIHVRSRAKTSVGRVMDDENLQHVACSIRRANERIIAWKSTQPHAGATFSHVILYGDFDYREGPKLKRVVEEGTGPDVKVSYISQPWKQPAIPDDLQRASSKTHGRLDVTTENVDADVTELWERFQDLSFDAMPIQVKILGIWNALAKRYGPKVCVVGHRSGFVEGAGFIGIPIFYLNNERRDLEKQFKSQNNTNTTHAPGELLWGPVQMPKTDRLRELSDVMNTFIPVEALGERNADGILHVERSYKTELMSALFIFMCCNVVGHEMSSWRETTQPAWTARVDMMHDQAGQDWLRERFDFASFDVDEEMPLLVWSGDARERWAEGIEKIQEYETELQREGHVTIEIR